MCLRKCFFNDEAQRPGIDQHGSRQRQNDGRLGLALRALGQGFKVLILQFLKGRANIGEITALTRSGLPVEIKQFGRDVFFKSRTCEPIDA
jgi:cob(I)alamin adenosyltransferase